MIEQKLDSIIELLTAILSQLEQNAKAIDEQYRFAKDYMEEQAKKGDEYFENFKKLYGEKSDSKLR